jgi:circadian clock protein KaiC
MDCDRRRSITTGSKAAQPLPKLPTGIEGFDALSRGGLPRHRTTLLTGGPGAGKTIFALQCLVNAIRARRGRGIFVAFEETPRQILANAATLDWRLGSLAAKDIFFLDAHMSPTLVKAGDFDLAGLLAMLTAKQEDIGAQWIVFDGIDVLLTLLQDPVAEMREIYRLRDWLAESSLTAIVTAKLEDQAGGALRYGFLQFMVDCVVQFARRQEDRVSAATVQITKYRGSDHATAEYPMSFGTSGIEVGAIDTSQIAHPASSERVTAGFERLDAMLGGGVFRGSSTLISGVPGTSKTTLAGKFAEAACERGERSLYVSYDEGAEQIVRNLSSVGIQLKPHLKSGLLQIFSAHTEGISAEEQLIKVRALIRTHQPRCMVIDPLTALAKAGSLGAARTVASRVVYMAKDAGITLLVTALSEAEDSEAESTDLQISTIADTWIHLSYSVRSGERNRALTVIKSRGTAHSNQVRELVLSKSGITLTDVYSAGGEVLMGTLRWEREADDKAISARRRTEFDHRRRELLFAEAKTDAQIKALQMELEKQRAELVLHSLETDQGKARTSRREGELLKRRSEDRPIVPAVPARKTGNGATR